jgi:hypothetical protein
MRVLLLFATLLATLLATSDGRYLRSTSSPVDAADEERVFRISGPLNKAIAKGETAPVKSSKLKKALKKVLYAILPQTRDYYGRRVYSNGRWKWESY